MKLIIVGKSALVVVICLFLTLLVVLQTSITNPQKTRETIAEWLPESKPSDISAHSPSRFTTANEAATLTRSNESDVFGGAGGTRKEDPMFSYFSRGWNSDSQWWQLSVLSTVGFERIELSFAARGSNTGPKNYALEYSVNGNEWLALTDSDNLKIQYTIADDNRFHRHGPFLLSDGINDLEQLHIRFFNTDTVSVIGETTKSTGTNYIADIVLTGIPA